jgi:hypothetical protein
MYSSAAQTTPESIMKTVIKATAANRVTIKYECGISGDVIESEFVAPLAGGYVRDAGGSQICDRLSTRGNTLMWSGAAPLANLIRAEYEAMRRAEAAEKAKYA